jgi:hypothetical protein
MNKEEAELPTAFSKGGPLEQVKPRLSVSLNQFYYRLF